MTYLTSDHVSSYLKWPPLRPRQPYYLNFTKVYSIICLVLPFITFILSFLLILMLLPSFIAPHSNIANASSQDKPPNTIIFQMINGVRVVENQVFNKTLVIDGEAWDGAIIRNNKFINHPGRGIIVSNVHNLTIEGNEFAWLKNAAIKLKHNQFRGTLKVLIRGNNFHDLPLTAVLSGELDVNTLVINNIFNNVATDIFANKKQHAIYLMGPDFLIEGNTISGVPDAHGISVRTCGVVRGNVVTRASEFGIKYHASSTAKGSGLLIIENNVLFNNGRGGIGFSSGKGVLVDMIAVRFNTSMNNSLGIEIGKHLNIVDFQIYGNLINEKKQNYFNIQTTPSVFINNYVSQSDPGFIDSAAHNYGLTNTSPARGYVRNVPGIPPYDILMNPMGQEPFNAGAYQNLF